LLQFAFFCGNEIVLFIQSVASGCHKRQFDVTKYFTTDKSMAYCKRGVKLAAEVDVVGARRRISETKRG